MIPSWREIGVDNFKVACLLMATRQPEAYRTCVSRFYYAAFSALTEDLTGKFDTANGQETPSHKGLPRLIKDEMPQLSAWNRGEILKMIRRLYAARIDADYRHRTVDRLTAQDARRDAVAIFEALGVKYDN